MATHKRIVEIIGVPLDLGANIRGANIGPSAIRIAGLKQKLLNLDHKVIDAGDLAVPVRESLPNSEYDTKFLGSIRHVCMNLAEKVEASLQKNHFPLIIGGDHCVAIGTIAGASHYFRQKNQELGLIWIDAHADVNDPASSPTGNIHGMPLAVALGHGHKKLTAIGGPKPKIKPENVALIGIRNIDGKEKEMLRKSGIRYYTMREIDERGMFKVMKEAIALVTKNTGGVHLSFDIDGVDPLYAPGVSTPETGGLSLREAHLALEMLADTRKLCSAEFVELNPIMDQAHKSALLTVELTQSALGKSIV